MPDVVDKVAARIPTPRDGMPGSAGDQGRDGRDGKDGKDGKDGRDGENGINGLAGRDGKDALHVDEFVAELQEDGRTVKISLTSGGKVFSSEIRFAVPLDRGVYREGEEYLRGDFVSFGGSGFIAQKDTKEKPETSADWRLAVKRGRDGRDGEAQAKASTPVKLR